MRRHVTLQRQSGRPGLAFGSARDPTQFQFETRVVRSAEPNAVAVAMTWELGKLRADGLPPSTPICIVSSAYRAMGTVERTVEQDLTGRIRITEWADFEQ